MSSSYGARAQLKRAPFYIASLNRERRSAIRLVCFRIFGGEIFPPFPGRIADFYSRVIESVITAETEYLGR